MDLAALALAQSSAEQSVELSTSSAVCRFLLAPVLPSLHCTEGLVSDQWLEWCEHISAAVECLESAGVQLPVIDPQADTRPAHPVLFDEYSRVFEYVMAPPSTTTASAGSSLVSMLPPKLKSAHSKIISLLTNLDTVLSAPGSSPLGQANLKLVVQCATKRALDVIAAGASDRVMKFAAEVETDPSYTEAVQKHATLSSNASLPDGDSGAWASMPGLIAPLNEVLLNAIAVAFPRLGEGSFDKTENGLVIFRCQNPKFGNYQCNSPMQIFQALKAKGDCPFKRAAEVAEVVVSKISATARSQMMSNVTISPQGFINVHLAPAYLSRLVAKVISDGPEPPSTKKRKIVVDFSSPNIAKEMHVGHLRSTIIGDTICRILEFCGHTVDRVNHVGDWGTQFGMLILHLKEEFPDFINSPPNITDLTLFYKGAKKRFDEDPAFKELARQTVVKLQSGDPECREVWNLLCDISRKEFDKVYARLGVVVHECGESFYNDRIPEVIETLEAIPDLVSSDEGAKCIFMRPLWDYPLFLQKSDGGYGYDSTDMAALRYRLFELDADWILYITDAGQESHFRMCFEAVRRAGWLDENRHRVDHLGFGVVQGNDGKRFKTRSGETVRLVDLLDEAKVRMEESLKARQQEGKCQLNDDEILKAAQDIGYGAVKYFDLSKHPATNYQFSYDKMLSTNGDTNVYLQFAHARLASIVRKGKEDHGVDVDQLVAGGNHAVLEDPHEISLALELLTFTDIVEHVLLDFLPHRVCEFLYRVSEKFSQFVTKCFVLQKGDRAKMESRLILCEAAGRIMRVGFQLLGINPLQRI